MNRLEFAKKVGQRVSRGAWERLTNQYSIRELGRDVVRNADGEWVSVPLQCIQVDGPKKARKQRAKSLGLNPKKV